MPYISKKEEELLLDIEQYIFTILNFKRNVFESEDEFMTTWSNYTKLWELNERLEKEREKINEKSKEGMREYRKKPEAKEKARLYMREYNKRKRS